MLIRFSVICLYLNLCACESIFQFSPYDARASASLVNRQNLDQISSELSSSDTVRIAVITDNHNYYQSLRTAVSKINGMHSTDFVLSLGDITETGLSQEFEWYLQEMKKLNRPFITAIGNHDHRSNGGIIYEKMFGPKNFYFEYGFIRFIIFNNTVWENGNSRPDFEWLERTLKSTDTTKQIYVAAHIQPGDDQWDGEMTKLYDSLMAQYHVNISLHGHIHKYNYYTMSNVKYLCTNSLLNKEFTYLSITANEIRIDRIIF